MARELHSRVKFPGAQRRSRRLWIAASAARASARVAIARVAREQIRKAVAASLSYNQIIVPPIRAVARIGDSRTMSRELPLCAQSRETSMRSILLWLLGVPIPIVILVALLYH